VPSPEPRRRWRRKAAVAFLILLLAATAGAATGYFLRLDLPTVRQLEDYQPPLITRLLDDRGGLLHQFAEERRILITAAQIPPNLRMAILAAEDPRFYSHVGVDPKAVARAAFKDLITLSKTEGASTITQQLARNLFLVPKKLWRRKVQEALLALEIERAYTKEEIFEFYVNQIYLGHGRYGFESASRYYFGLPARDLSLAQAALLAGLAQRPEGFSPFRNPRGATARRNHILDRMFIEGYIEAAPARETQRADLGLVEREVATSAGAPYFIEEVRRDLAGRYGDEAIYQEGLDVWTTVDIRLQSAAQAALIRGLHALDKRIGWRGPEANLLEGNDADLDSLVLPEWRRDPIAGDRVPGIVLDAEPGTASVRVGNFHGELSADGVAWTGESDPAALVQRGDRIWVEVHGVHEDRLELSLDQRPDVEGALVAIDPASGRSQFNRATQALRQAGSAFKPFVFTAALYAGLTAADVVYDEPTLLLDRQTGSVYQPNNYKRDYNGVITLRYALEKSVNIATVRLLNTIGYQPVIQLARRMGITSPLPPYPSLALGSGDMNLMEVTSAYGAFPNQGVLVEPHMVRRVTQRDGSLREVARPTAVEALRPDIAYLMTRQLQGVVERGTGRGAQVLGRPIGGKTGTTDDYSDAWFVGFTPSMVVGVWVGFDQKITLGRSETGARAALPIWIDFMGQAMEGVPPESFVPPSNIEQVPIDRRTGLRAELDTGCQEVIMEAFLEGTAPTRPCSATEHYRAGLPYFLQRYEIDDQRRLRISALDLEWLTRWQATELKGWFGPSQLVTEYRGVEASVPVTLDAAFPDGGNPFEVPYPSRLVDRRGILYQDGAPVPPPEFEEEEGEAATDGEAEPSAEDTPLPEDDPAADPLGPEPPPAIRPDSYRWLGLDGRDALVIYVAYRQI